MDKGEQTNVAYSREATRVLADEKRKQTAAMHQHQFEEAIHALEGVVSSIGQRTFSPAFVDWMAVHDHFGYARKSVDQIVKLVE